MSNEGGWLIAKSGAISPPVSSTFDAAYLVKLERGSSKRDVVVEFADPSAVASNGYAEEVTRRFLRDREPPQHLVVEVSGTVRVELGPREGADDGDSSSLEAPVGRSPQRARNHRRGG